MENKEQNVIIDTVDTNLFPVVPLRGKVAFPNTNISIEIGRKMTLKAIDRC